VRERFALVRKEKDDVAGFGLLLAQPKPQTDAVDRGRVLRPFSE
jgi:hypothetical protein